MTRSFSSAYAEERDVLFVEILRIYIKSSSCNERWGFVKQSRHQHDIGYGSTRGRLTAVVTTADAESYTVVGGALRDAGLGAVNLDPSELIDMSKTEFIMLHRLRMELFLRKSVLCARSTGSLRRGAEKVVPGILMRYRRKPGTVSGMSMPGVQGDSTKFASASNKDGRSRLRSRRRNLVV